MGYITTVLTPEDRRRAGPKDGAQATATIACDPSGAVSVQIASVPQGQGHRTVAAQIVADVLGLTPRDIRVVADVDTARDGWSIASGNYSSRFAPAVCGAVGSRRHPDEGQAGALRGRAAQRAGRRDRIRRRPRARPQQSGQCDPVCAPGGGGALVARDRARRRARRCARPCSGRRRSSTAPTEADEVNSSLCHGFIFDFCGVEIDRATGALRIDKYVTTHDCGRILHPGHGRRPDHRRLRARGRRRRL